MKTTLLLRFDQELKERLKEISLSDKRSLSSLIVKILSDYAISHKIGEQNGI